jgi:hypothetical protein
VTEVGSASSTKQAEASRVEGGRIRAGGGEGRPVEVGGVGAVDDWAEGITGGDIPERCGHLYWLVSGVET